MFSWQPATDGRRKGIGTGEHAVGGGQGINAHAWKIKLRLGSNTTLLSRYKLASRQGWIKFCDCLPFSSIPKSVVDSKSRRIWEMPERNGASYNENKKKKTDISTCYLCLCLPSESSMPTGFLMLKVQVRPASVVEEGEPGFWISTEWID